jgi:hypothetical protein
VVTAVTDPADDQIWLRIDCDAHALGSDQADMLAKGWLPSVTRNELSRRGTSGIFLCGVPQLSTGPARCIAAMDVSVLFRMASSRRVCCRLCKQGRSRLRVIEARRVP